MRKPSCLISWIQPGPEGGAVAGDGRDGSIMPRPGRVRSRNDMAQHKRKLSLLRIWEQPAPVACSFGGSGIRHGEDHDEISTDRLGGGLIAGRSHDSHGSKWSANWRISGRAVEPESLWTLRLPASPLCLLSSLLRLLSCLPHRGWLLGLLPHCLAGAR